MLVDDFRRGDPEAWKQIYDFYSRRVERQVKALARSSLNPRVWQPSLVGDIVQETFVRAFACSARYSFDPNRAYTPYLMAIAKNCFIDALRATSREILLEPDALAQRLDIETCETQAHHEPKLTRALSTYIDSLPTPLRAVYEQRIGLGRSQEATCVVLGLSRRKLRTAEQRLRQRLRKDLAAAGLSLSELRG